jgi:hypothetical protein
MIEIDDDEWPLGLEVGRGIIEGEVAVFADSYEGDVDRGLLNEGTDSPAFGFRVVAGIQQVRGSDTSLADQPFAKVLSKTRRMRVIDADVLVQVKQRDTLPVYPRQSGERVEKV